MDSRAYKWLISQYQCVLQRMRLRQYREQHPTVSASCSEPIVTLRGPRQHYDQLESRLMLSSTTLDEAANLRIGQSTPSQVFYLDTTGAKNVTYRGPITVKDIDVPAFAAPASLAGQEDPILQATLGALEDAYAGHNVEFTFDRPTDGAYSTIFIGGSNAAFTQWGYYHGVAEAVDLGNQNPSDIAFVFSGSIGADGLTTTTYSDQLAEVIAHEAGHLLGQSHDDGHTPQHARSALDASPLKDVAFDPKVHVEIGKDAVADAVADGKVTINGADYVVHPKIVAALTNHPSYYNAGAVGPDGFPDVLMGQFAIHPVDHGTWLTRVLDMAWKAQEADPEVYNDVEKSQILAWTYGYLTHSAGDHFAHTLVNEFAEGVAPGFGAAAESLPTDQRDLGNMLRHFMTEAYIADAMPGVDHNRDERTVLPDGDLSDDSTPGIKYDAPIRFIYEALIRPFQDDPTHIVEMDWSGGTLTADAGTNTFVRSDGDWTKDGFKKGHKITVQGFGNALNNDTFIVSAVSATTLTVDGPLASETASGDEKIFVKIAKTSVTVLGVNVANSTFTRGTGSFEDDGFVPGMRFSTYGFASNTGDYIVKSVTAGALEVYGTLTADAGAGSGNEQLIVYGQRGPALDKLFQLRDKLFLEAVSKGARGPAGTFGNLVGNLIDKAVTGTEITQADKDALFKEYLYNWVSEIDEGIRHWGEVGLAFTKAMFDPQSRRDLQNKVGASKGADTLDNILRRDAEAGVGVLDIFLEELDDPNGDGKTDDSFINQHLLAMAGLPSELGVVRQGLQVFGDAVGDLLAPLQQLFNPIKAGIAEVKEYATNFVKDQIKQRLGFDFDTFAYLKDLSAKMDLKSIGFGSFTVPVFKPGDHEKLDALLHLSGSHHEPPPTGYDNFPGVTFYPGAEGVLSGSAAFSKVNFAAYANSVKLTKMLLLMETAPDGPSTANGQLSALYSALDNNPAAASYNFTLLNMHGAHGGNVLTTTLPGVGGTTPWMVSIDADQVWRADNYTTTNALFRVSTQNDTASPAQWTATALPAGTYEIYATWQGNVTQKLDNLTNSAFPDQHLSPASNAQYSIFDDLAGPTPVVTSTQNQRLFTSDLEHDGLAYDYIGTITIGATGIIRVQLSNEADGHVMAGPILLKEFSSGTLTSIRQNRDPETLASLASGYSDSSSSWTDMKYEGGGGNNPLWESARMRGGFRTVFTDWRNGALQFPSLGDGTSNDPNDFAITKTQLPSHATPFGPPEPDNVVQIPITTTVKNAILDGVNGLVNLVTTLEGTPPFNIKLPGLEKSLAEIIGFSKKVDESVRKPIVDYFAADVTPTFNELFEVIKAQIGGRMDNFEPVVEFDVDFRKLFTVNDLTLSLGKAAEEAGFQMDAKLAADASIAFLDAIDATQPKLTFGIDLTPGTSTPLDERIYIKADRAVIHAEVHATPLNASARLGFLSLGVVGGSIDLEADVEIDFVDPTPADGKITLADMVTPLGDLIDVTATGTLDGNLPVAVQAGLAGMPAVSVGDVVFNATNIFDLSTYNFEFDGNFDDVLQFNNIDAASLVGLLGKLTFWLDEIRRSDKFANLDVPLVGPALDKVLGFADAFRDKLLIDDRDNGVDDANTLLSDVNEALAAAGLGRKLKAEATTEGKIKLVSIDPSITQFSVSTTPSNLGFGSQSSGATSATFEEITASTAAPTNGQLDSDVTLSITINSDAPVEVKIVKTATDANTKIGDDVWKLVNADNGATFTTVQEMAAHLTSILGASSQFQYHAVDDPTTAGLNEAETLTFSLNLAEIIGQANLPLGFSLDDLPDFLQLQTSGDVSIVATGGLNLTLGVYLGAAEASTKLDGDEALTEINNGITVSKEERITGVNEVRTVYGQLSGDAKFSLSVDGGAPVNVTVLETATSSNTTAQDLADDINASLLAAGLGAKVQAQTVNDTPGQQRLKLVALPGTSTLRLLRTSGDPTVKDMGFAPEQPKATLPAEAVLLAGKDLPALRGRLTGNASFTLNLSGGKTLPITVTAAQSSNNRYAFDIVNDINANFNRTTHPEWFYQSGTEDGQPVYSPLVEVSFSDGRLTFTTRGGATGFSISNLGGTAASELGLAAGTGDKTDLIITVRQGTSYRVTLDDAISLNDVIDEIAGQTNNKVTAALNERKTGLILTDVDFALGGPGVFKVQPANNSPAAMDLGILAEDATESVDENGAVVPPDFDGLIEGADIAGLTPLDRFFIQATPVGDPALASAAVVISTPTPVKASAKVGFVGLELTGTGALPGSGNKALEANLSLRLNEPTGSTDGRISLAEVINGLDDLGALFDISLTGAGAVDFAITADPVLADLGINVSGAKIDLDVNLGDLFASTPVEPSFSFTVPDDLVSFQAPEFNFQSIIAGLRALTGFLDDFETFDFLSKPLPVVNVSVSDLVDVADRFADAVDEAVANPAGTLQLLESKLKDAFGIPASSNAINLVLVHDNNGTDGNTADDFDILKLELSLDAGFSETLGLDFDLGQFVGLDLPIELGGGADLLASGSVNLDLDIGFRIDDPTQVYLFNETTGISGELNLGGNNLVFRGAVGPVGVFVNGGTVDIHGTLPDNKLFTVGLDGESFTNGRVLIDGSLDLGDMFNPLVGGAVAVNLPVYFPTDSVRAGTVLFDANLAYDESTGFEANLDPRAVDENNAPISFSDLFAFDPADLSLLDQLLLGVDGVDLFLGGLQDVMDGQIGDITLPLIGDKLAGAADVIGDFRETFIDGFREAIEGLANPGAAFAAAGIGGGGASLAAAKPDPVSEILFGLLEPLLLDTNGSGAVDVGDITFVTNIDQPGVAPKDVFFDWDFKLGDDLVDASAGIGFDIGIPGLGLETTGDVNVLIGWELALGFGLNYEDGFYLDIADQSELELNVDVTVPGVGITGTLGFLQISATEDVDPNAPDPVTHLGATFAVDIKNRSDTATVKDDKLGFSELGRIGIDVGIAADAVADLAMKLALSSDLVPGAATNFPSIVADFLLDWRLGDRATDQYVSLTELDGSFLKNGLQFVGFEHVGLDLGTYFSDVIGPIVDKVQEVTEPIKPFLDFLTEPIPVISDLAGPTSLLDIAALSGAVNPGIIKAIEVVDAVIDIAHSIPDVPSGNVIMYFDEYLPSLVIYEAPSGLAPNAVPDIDLTNPNLDLKALSETLLSGLDFLPEEIQEALGDVAADVAEGVKDMLPGGAASEGFKLPIIQDPSQIFGMLLGQPADLVTFDMAPLELDANFSAFFSIFGPLGVSINAEFTAKFGPFKFGYDTYGITQFADSDFRNPELLFDGLYVSDIDGEGNDIAELQFDAGLWAAAELNLGIARGGVAGGLFAEVDFDLHDPNDDGRVRIKEIITNVLNEFRYGEPFLSPLAMFDISGKLTAELFAFLKIDFGFFEVDKKFQLTEPITLLDFETDFERYETLAEELPGGVLQINMGKFADQQVEGDKVDGDDEFWVKQDGAGKVKVWAPSLGIDESEAQSYKVSSLILALGGEGNDTINLSGVTDANIRYELEGNAGNDTIVVGGAGAARILGGAGDDTLTGAGGNDTIFGEAGVDNINGGAGRDWLFGDGSVKDSIVGDALSGEVKANDGVDTITGGADEDIVFGGGGNDIVEGGDAVDVLIGDNGLVTVGSDRIAITVQDTDGRTGGDDTLRGDAGADRIFGGFGNDILEGGADTDTIYGESGADNIDGGTENDLLYGGIGNDTIDAGAGADTIYGEEGNDTLNGDAENDQIEGGTGADVIHGNDGNDVIYGNSDPDKMFGDAGDDFIEGGQSDDVALGGTGPDLLVAGYGSDTLDGEAGSDSYRITARGGPVTELSTAYDSGLTGESDSLTLVGTADNDTVLLRAMADYYFPTKTKLIGDGSSDGLTDKVLASGEPDKLAAILQAVEDSYGPHEIPDGLITQLISLFTAHVRTDVQTAISTEYVPPTSGSTVPALVDIESRVNAILASESRGKLAEIQKAISELYGDNAVPATMFNKIIDAWQPAASLKAGLEGAISDKYQDETTVLGSSTDTGFVALINNGGANVERFNYRFIEGLVVDTLQGDDYVVSDDVIAATTVNLGDGEDRFQSGQVFRSERVRDEAGELITGITAEDVFTSLEITRGWLSNGVSRPTTVNGGEGNDNFTVFRNVAALNLNGGNGDDNFTIRAFALKGSSDNERARTDMKGDGGADTILYAVNAPVGIDGGDGFDTVRVVGTEFGDDFVVTDEGVFGAGLNVSYVNIEKLVADGAEGDDRYFVQSTGLGVITEIDGGLGSDSFFVGGNPSNAPIPVISNDLKGHSGVVLHNVESTDAAWNGAKVEGVSANVGDDEEDAFVITESDGGTRVAEGGNAAVAGVGFDGYGIRLTRKPGAGQTVTLNVLLAGMAPEDRARAFKDLEFYAPHGSDSLNGAPNGALLGFNALTGEAIMPVLTFNEFNWNVPQFVKFRAAADLASEGRRFTFINHTAQDSNDPDYQSAQALSVKVRMEDNDRDGVIVTPSGKGNTVLEDGFTDSFDVVLAQQPTHNVTVTLNALNSQVGLSHASLTFTPGDWNTARTVTLTGSSDTILEGFHTDYVSFTVSSSDTDTTVALPGFVQVDGDFDKIGVQDIPPEKPTSYVLLPNRPIAGTLQVKLAGVALPASRFSLSGNTLSFLAADGTPEFVTGKVETLYSYVEEGYDGSIVQDQVVDIYDQDAPTVIIEQTEGSTDVIEGADGKTDTYRVRLSQAPSANVTVNADAVKTRTTYGRTANFVEQVTVNGASATALTFTPGNWHEWQTVTVGAAEDSIFDGNDTQVFAPDLQTVNKIRGPLLIEGAAGAGSLSLPAPLMLPNERNVLEPDGLVKAFTPGNGGGALETMTVSKADLEDVVDELDDEDSTIDAIGDLVGKTLEMSSGPGTGVVLDATRPNDLFDRFWLITNLVVVGDDVVLTLQNPTLVDPGQPNITAPTTESEYAITALSINFFADEREQVDYLYMYDEDSVANEQGALTASDGIVLDFNAATSVMTVDTAALQAAAGLVGVAGPDDLVGRTLDITVGPGQGGRWTITGIADGTTVGTKVLNLTLVTAGTGGTPTNRSEFRIEGADSKGRIVGFGMGPNVLLAGRPQPGGISYGDMEVVQVNLGLGNDDVRVDYTTNAEDHTTKRSGDFYTLTMLNTGGGNDNVDVDLDQGQDGDIAIRGQAGDDTVDASNATFGIAVFGEEGNDQITGGDGEDLLFGDFGRVDFVDAEGEIITRLGHTVPFNPVNPVVTSATANTITDLTANFATEYGGLAGLMIQIIMPDGSVQNARIVANTSTTITVDQNWERLPISGQPIADDNSAYRISALPENQGDGTYRGPRIAWSIDSSIGGNDTINAGGGDDLAIGGAANDTINAGAGDDTVAGDNLRADYTPVEGNDGLTKLVSVSETGVGGDDTINAGTEADLVLGGLGNDTVHGQAGNDLLIGDRADVIYKADGVTIDSIETTDRANGGDDRIYGDEGDDMVAGGTGADALDGGSEKDLILGDNVRLVNNVGSNDATKGRYRTVAGQTLYNAAGQPQVNGPAAVLPGTLPAWTDYTITLDQTAENFGSDYMAGGAGDDQLFGQLGNDTIQGDGSIDLTVSSTQASVEDHAGIGTDGDDYIEGNAGEDLIFGNLGQDDLIGGSSDLFSYTAPALRPDGADTIFGGAGTDLARNNHGDTTATGHARDADTILGDNGNVYRLVDIAGSYRVFTYDNYGTLKLIPRSVQHLDYTYGGNATTDIGAADLIHGELGDDSIYGTVGDDVLFGEGQDDDIYGGIGHDRIYGGGGEDGIVGDDGLIFTSRNGLTETLHGVNTASTMTNLAMPGPWTAAWIYITGRLNKSVQLLAYDTGGNDVIYGGLGDDFLHAGAGNDAVSGAEALAEFYVTTPVVDQTPLDYDPVTRKLAGYDANAPLVKVANFLLNFEATTAGEKIEDGKDRIFGDLGHDWIVGGTGKDRLFGGVGDDMINADDNLDTAGGANSQPDAPAHADADFVYGGDGLDVMIANTGGERMFDWGGEFNTYVVPYNPFGEPTVYRRIAPGLVEFIRVLGVESGADRTRIEPNGELGLFLQSDPQWGANHAGPRDPQGPNAKAKQDTPGGPEDDRNTVLPI